MRGPGAGGRCLPAALAVLALAALAGCGPRADSPAEPGAAPDFEVAKLGGGKLKLSELRGKTVLLDFWATWCEPCLLQVPELNALWRERRDMDLVILGVAVDSEGESVVGPWVAEQRVEYPILLGSEDMAFDFGVVGFPTLVVVDPQGRIGRTHVGLASREELLQLLP